MSSLQVVAPDPSYEEMKMAVCDKKIRPDCPNRWQSSMVNQNPAISEIFTLRLFEIGMKLNLALLWYNFLTTIGLSNIAYYYITILQHFSTYEL